MDILIYCLLSAILIPYLVKMPLGYAMNKLGGYDNQNPRAQQARLEGFGARCLAAHQNGFESLIVFSVAIAVALATAHTGDYIQQLAILHVIARILYSIFYLANLDKLRSLVWGVGIYASFAIIWNCLA